MQRVDRNVALEIVWKIYNGILNKVQQLGEKACTLIIAAASQLIQAVRPPMLTALTIGMQVCDSISRTLEYQIHDSNSTRSLQR